MPKLLSLTNSLPAATNLCTDQKQIMARNFMINVRQLCILLFQTDWSPRSQKTPHQSQFTKSHNSVSWTKEATPSPSAKCESSHEVLALLRLEKELSSPHLACFLSLPLCIGQKTKNHSQILTKIIPCWQEQMARRGGGLDKPLQFRNHIGKCKKKTKLLRALE